MNKHANKSNITYDLVEGEISPEELAEVIKEFLNDPRCNGYDGVEQDA